MYLDSLDPVVSAKIAALEAKLREAAMDVQQTYNGPPGLGSKPGVGFLESVERGCRTRLAELSQSGALLDQQMASLMEMRGTVDREVLEIQRVLEVATGNAYTAPPPTPPMTFGQGAGIQTHGPHF